MPQNPLAPIITTVRIGKKIFDSAHDRLQKWGEAETAAIRGQNQEKLYKIINKLLGTNFDTKTRSIDYMSRQDCQQVVNWFNNDNGGYLLSSSYTKITLPDSLFYKNAQGVDEANFQNFFEYIRPKVKLSSPYTRRIGR